MHTHQRIQHTREKKEDSLSTGFSRGVLHSPLYPVICRYTSIFNCNPTCYSSSMGESILMSSFLLWPIPTHKFTKDFILLHITVGTQVVETTSRYRHKNCFVFILHFQHLITSLLQFLAQVCSIHLTKESSKFYSQGKQV